MNARPVAIVFGLTTAGGGNEKVSRSSWSDPLRRGSVRLARGGVACCCSVAFLGNRESEAGSAARWCRLSILRRRSVGWGNSPGCCCYHRGRRWVSCSRVPARGFSRVHAAWERAGTVRFRPSVARAIGTVLGGNSSRRIIGKLGEQKDRLCGFAYQGRGERLPLVLIGRGIRLDRGLLW